MKKVLVFGCKKAKTADEASEGALPFMPENIFASATATGVTDGNG